VWKGPEYINISGVERARSFWEDKGGKETVRETPFAESGKLLKMP
jgi:hypothetical protein